MLKLYDDSFDFAVGRLGGNCRSQPHKNALVGWRWGGVKGGIKGGVKGGKGGDGVAIELLATICCFYYDLNMDKFTIDFIREKIEEAVQQNPGVRALNVYLKGKLYNYIISYDSLKHTVTGVVLQQGHKRKPINLSDILFK